MNKSDKLYYALELNQDGEDGTGYLAHEFNKAELAGMINYADSREAKAIIRSAHKRA